MAHMKKQNKKHRAMPTWVLLVTLMCKISFLLTWVFLVPLGTSPMSSKHLLKGNENGDVNCHNDPLPENERHHHTCPPFPYPIMSGMSGTITPALPFLTRK
jgi:hypothetical protein